MAGQKGMHNIGRPTKAEVEKAKFRQKSFYFPLRFEHIWKEFDKISRRLVKNSIYKERCKSIAIRRLLFRYIIKHTDKNDIKIELLKYIEDEEKTLAEQRRKYKLKKEVRHAPD